MRAEKKMPLRPTPPVVSSQAFHWALFSFGGSIVIGAMAYLFWTVAIGFFWLDRSLVKMARVLNRGNIVSMGRVYPAPSMGSAKARS